MHDGTVLWESAAITMHLGETFGVERKLYPPPGAKRAEAMKWIVWANVTLGEAVGRWTRNTSDYYPEEQRNAKAGDVAKADMEKCLAILNGDLEGKAFLTGEYTLADTHVNSLLDWLRFMKVDMAPYPNVVAWGQRCAAAPRTRESWPAPEERRGRLRLAPGAPARMAGEFESRSGRGEIQRLWRTLQDDMNRDSFARWSPSFLAAFALCAGCGIARVKTSPRIAPEDPEARPTRVLLADGRQMEVRCVGRGSPTVVFENGLGVRYDGWLRVATRVGSKTTACVYSRAGIGTSDAASLPRTSRGMSVDLSEVLGRISTPTPIILVGHSIGGFVVRVFADAHPDLVLAVVLVESAHPNQALAFERPLPSRDGDTPTLRAFRDEEIGAWTDWRKNPEGMDLAASAAEVRAVRVPASCPIRVISGKRQPNPFGLPTPLVVDIGKTWDALQEDLTTLSLDSRRRVSPLGAHFVQQDDPDLVIEEQEGQRRHPAASERRRRAGRG